MDDKTVIICAATLCLIGVALTETLGSGVAGRTAHQPGAAALSASPAVIAGLDRHDQSAVRAARAFATSN